jgi:hypothetical protein
MDNKQCIIDFLMNILSVHVDQYTKTLRNTQTSLDQVRPYVTSTPPNIISPFHLISQSLCYEHVFLCLKY